MPGIDVNSLLSVNRGLPTPSTDGTTPTTNQRGGRYREQHVLPMYQNLYCYGDEGSYFVFTNPTVSTGISFGAAAQTTFSDTAGGLAIINADTSILAKRIYLDYIKLICTTTIAGTITTPFYQMAGKLDTIASRYTSGGTPQVIGVNPNSGAGLGSISKVFFGAVTFAASTAAARLVFRAAVRGVAATPAINDTIVIKFGSNESAVGAQNIAAAAPTVLLFHAPPVVVEPASTFSLHAWAAGQSGAPVYEFEIGLWER